MSYQNIIVETKGRVGIIRLNRPQALNALNRALIGELIQAIDAYEADEAIGCLLITGNEKAFAAGADIKEMADKTFIASSIRFAAGTTRATSPDFSASAASIMRPVRIISMALALPTARVSRCVPPMPGMTPSLISGCPNLRYRLRSRCRTA